MDTLRLKIQKKLVELLEQITVANGFDYDLTGSVFRGRNELSESDKLPCIAILESPKPNDKTGLENASEATETWDLYMQGFINNDDYNNPTDEAHRFLGAVKKQLSKVFDEDDPYYLLGELIHDMKGSGGICRPADDFAKKDYFILNIQVKLVDDWGNPYE